MPCRLLFLQVPGWYAGCGLERVGFFRGFPKCAGSLLGVLSLAAFGSVAPAQAAEKPNVLFIAVDDLNDWIACLGGHPQCQSPNIDRLAAKGVLFTRSYCAAPACNPSRAALMTGVRPFTSGVYHNPQPWRKAMPDVVTLAAAFHGAWIRSRRQREDLSRGVSRPGFVERLPGERRRSQTRGRGPQRSAQPGRRDCVGRVGRQRSSHERLQDGQLRHRVSGAEAR